MDFIMIAPQGWDFEIGSNARNMALEISKKHRVLYVNPPTDLITLIKNFGKRRRSEKLFKSSENVYVYTPEKVVFSINWIPFKFLYQLLNRINNNRFAADINYARKQLNIVDYILLNDNYMFNGFHLKELLKPRHYVYYIRDYLVIQPYFKRHGTWLEPALMKKADVVVANSTYLAEYAKKYNPQSFYIGQGCEVDMFNEKLVDKLPSDLTNITKPIVGYVGFLTSMRLDIKLLMEIANKRKDWNLVLVGPEDDEFKKSELHQFSNVRFLGRKSPDSLPQYMAGFDVCINPQVVNELTIGNYPRKIDEYLAMGKPVVATATKAMEVFADYTFLASNVSEFITMIEKALAEKGDSIKAKRISFAQSHTWENSVDEMYKAINQISH